MKMSINNIENRFEELEPDSETNNSSTTQLEHQPQPNPIEKLTKSQDNKQKADDHDAASDDEEEQECFHDSIQDPLDLTISAANSLKQEGNVEFAKKRYQVALNKYSEAIFALPPLPPSSSTPTQKDTNSDKVNQEDEIFNDQEEADGKPIQSSSTSQTKAEDLSPQPTVDPRISTLRSVLNANSGACYLKLEDWKSAVDSCTLSLKDDPTYVKALHRRAQANERLGTWASLQASLDDYNHLNKLPNLPSSLIKEIRSSQIRLPNLIHQKSEADKAEMMSKLKDIGNTVLGKFGMSTDNFKFTPNETGGYSMSFQR